MRTIIALLMLTVAAQAQTYPGWENGACYENGIYFPARSGPPWCVSEDKAISAMTSPPPNLTYRVISGLATSSNVGIGISAAPRPKCEDGWSLVDAGRPMCARELRDPR